MIEKTYMGRCPGCNRVVAASVDLPATEVAKWIKDGLIVSRVTVAEARAADWMCECKKKNQMDLGREE